MTRRQALGYWILGALLCVSLWRLTTTLLPLRPEWLTPTLVPLILAAVGLGLFFYGWQSATSGPLPIAGALLGSSAVLFTRLLDPDFSGWLAVLGLVPMLAGVGMLVEIQRGHGWQYSRRQGVGLILFGGVLALVMAFLAVPDGEPASRVAQLSLFPGGSVFSGIVTDLGLFFGSFIERIVR